MTDEQAIRQLERMVIECQIIPLHLLKPVMDLARLGSAVMRIPKGVGLVHDHKYEGPLIQVSEMPDPRWEYPSLWTWRDYRYDRSGPDFEGDTPLEALTKALGE